MTAGLVLRAVRARWLVVLLIGVIGMGAALAASQWRNARIDPLFEGSAPVSVLRLPNESDEDFAQRVQTVAAQARGAAAGELSDEGLDIISDEEAGTVSFIARSDTFAGAMEGSVGLRDIFVGTDSTVVTAGQLGPALDAIVAEIALLESQLAQLQSNVGEDPIAAAERAALLTELENAARLYAQSTSRLLDPNLTDDARAEAEANQVAAQATLDSIDGRLDALPAPSNPAPSTESRLRAMALEQRIRDLESQYIASATSEEQTGSESFIGDPRVTDLTGDEIPPLQASAVGLVAGLLLGVVAVTVAERLQRPVRDETDLENVIAVEVERRPGRQQARAAADWYPAAGRMDRVRQLQRLRSQIEPHVEPGVFLTVQGLEIQSREVAQLGIDLAWSLAAADHPVLFLDTDFSGESGLKIENRGATLADMIRTSHGPTERNVIKNMLWDREDLAPHLVAVAAGVPTTDPIDALAGAAFGIVLEEARSLAETIVVSIPQAGSPAADAVATRAGSAVLVIEKHRTRHAEVRAAMTHFSRMGVAVLATVLISGRAGRTRRRSSPLAWLRRRRRPTERIKNVKATGRR